MHREVAEHYVVDANALSPPLDDSKAVKANFLGQGSYGMVYRAVYKEMEVAVKTIRDDIIEVEEATKEIEKECSIMIQLHHANLGRIYGFNLKKGSACMVMELAELGSLYDILKNKSKYPHLSWYQRLVIARDIMRGLHYLHDRPQPILHRDLKSLNVMIRQHWSAFIADLGFARIKLTSQTLGTKGIGSAPWMAPEMQDPDEVSTPAIDIYSFGMILYELLTRETPWGIEKLTTTQIAVAVFRGKRPLHLLEESKYESMKECPTGYVELMKECWDQDPLRRPKTSSILSRLELFLKATPLKQEIKEQASSKEQAFINTLLSPLGLEETYSKNFLDEGYDSLLAIRDLTFDDLKNIKIKTGHQKLILNAIQTLVLASTQNTTSQTPSSYVVQSSLLTLSQPILKTETPSSYVVQSSLLTVPQPMAKTEEATFLRLGHLYRTGTGGIKQDHQEALKHYFCAVAQGDAEAEAWVAFSLLSAEGGVTKDDQEAFRLSKLGVQKGVVLAYSNLGVCYEEGRGVKKDVSEAIRLYRQGAELGEPYAQNALGVCYENGTGVTKDEKEAVRLYQLAAAQGHAKAQYNLGACYENETGVMKDEKEAVRLYQLAAAQGHANAQNGLGFCYLSGSGVTKDEKEAVRWYQLAAAQGHAKAQYNLNLCYRDGIGVMNQLGSPAAVRHYDHNLYQLGSTEASSIMKAIRARRKLKKKPSGQPPAQTNNPPNPPLLKPDPSVSPPPQQPTPGTPPIIKPPPPSTSQPPTPTAPDLPTTRPTSPSSNTTPMTRPIRLPRGGLPSGPPPAHLLPVIKPPPSTSQPPTPPAPDLPTTRPTSPSSNTTPIKRPTVLPRGGPPPGPPPPHLLPGGPGSPPPPPKRKH